MRIGMLADVYKPHVSGITNYIDLSKQHLEKFGHDVYVFTFGDTDYVDTDTNVIRSPGVPLVDTDFYLNVRYSHEAQKLLRAMDIVHVHHPFLSGRLALRYCKPRGIPIVFTNHTRYDLTAQAYLPALPKGMSETFLRAYLPGFCADVDFVIAPSPGMKRVLQNLGVESHIEVVPNGVDFSAFKNDILPIDRAAIGFGGADVVLIYAGRLSPEKSLNFLLRAFNGAAQAFDQIRLLIVGDGPERDNLEDLVRRMGITDRVHFTGMVDYEEVPRYLAAANAFVISSVAEVHPLSVIEAMGAGLPVLGVESPGVGDTVQDGGTGFLAPQEDLAAFTAKLIRLSTNHDERKILSIKAQQAARAFAIERTTKLIMAHYETLVDQSYGLKRSISAQFLRVLDRWFR